MSALTLPATIEAQHAAAHAVAYALDRVQTDADFRYHMLDTQTMRLLVHAESLLRGDDEEAVMTRRRVWVRAHADQISRCARNARTSMDLLETCAELARFCAPGSDYYSPCGLCRVKAEHVDAIRAAVATATGGGE